jgi:hypothetical protein
MLLYLGNESFESIDISVALSDLRNSARFDDVEEL